MFVRESLPHTSKALLNLKDGCWRRKVTHVAMESTAFTGSRSGRRWRKLPVILTNPYQIKSIPGRKTDVRDSQWIAELLAHGLIQPSFVRPGYA